MFGMSVLLILNNKLYFEYLCCMLHIPCSLPAYINAQPFILICIYCIF